MNRITLGIVVVLALVVVALFFIFNPFTMQGNPALNPAADMSNTASSTPPNGGLVIQDTTVGTGAQAQAGDLVTINYTGKLQDGTVFDTTAGKTPFEFVLGAGQVIPGFDEGIMGMHVGGTRTLIIPPTLGYGAQAVGPIPANSTLTFTVTLLNVAAAASSTPVAPEGAAAD